MGSYIYIVTLLMNYDDLSRRMSLNAIPVLGEDELMAYAPKIFGAVQEIHKAGYLHNNIIPENIVLHRNKKSSSSNDYSIRLGGFGQLTPLKMTSKNVLSSKKDVNWLQTHDALLQAPEVLATLGANRS
jgi:serine/threonine protein kinase